MEAPLITPTYPKLADQKDGEEVRKSMLDLAQKMNEVVLSERRRVDNLVNSADDPYFIMYEDADTHVFALPENAPLKTTYSIMRTVASTNQISVSTSGGDTVEGSASFVTHGAAASATLNTQIVQITKTSATGWSFTGGVISGYVSGRGWYIKFGDGTLIQYGITPLFYVSPGLASPGNLTLPTSYFDNTFIVSSIMRPQSYWPSTNGGQNAVSANSNPSAYEFNLVVHNGQTTQPMYFWWITIGRWKA